MEAAEAQPRIARFLDGSFRWRIASFPYKLHCRCSEFITFSSSTTPSFRVERDR